MKRTQKKWFSWIALVVVLSLALPWAAFADDVDVDQIDATPANDPLALGIICAGKSQSGTASFQIRRQGNTQQGNVFANEATVTLEVLTVPSGISAVMTADNTIVLPSDWTSQSNGTLSADTASSLVTVTAGTTLGNFNAVVKYRATGAKAGEGTLTVDGNLNVTWTVISCQTNQPPTVDAGGSYSGNEGSAISLNGTASDPDDDQLTYKWTYSAPTGVTCTFSNDAIEDPTITCDDNGSVTVTLTVSDGQASASDDATVTVNNVAPTATLSNNGPVDEGSAATISFSAQSDPSSVDTNAGFRYSFACDGLDASLATTYAAAGTSASTTCTFTDNGSYTVKGRIFDKDDGYNTYETTVVVNNVAPEITSLTLSATEINENDSVTLSGQFKDPGADTFTIEVDWGEGDPASVSYDNCDDADPTTYCFSATHQYLDDDPSGTLSDDYTIKVTVTDDDRDSDTGNATVTVKNVAPTVSITSPADGSVFAVNTLVNFVVQFTDPGTQDTWSCALSSEAGTFDPSCQSGDTLQYTFTTAGVYNVKVTVTDDDGGSGSASIMVVAYDPSAGFVTGGGWIMSPAGAYAADASLMGKATFGFVSKYLKGANKPTGNTEFQFHAAGFNFKSTDYEWLVVSGTQAQYKGTGTVNGSGEYGFLLTAGDGTPDTFRLKVWDKASGNTVYDNGSNQPISSGSIIIHTAKK